MGLPAALNARMGRKLSTDLKECLCCVKISHRLHCFHRFFTSHKKVRELLETTTISVTDPEYYEREPELSVGPGRPRTLNAKEEFFLVMFRLRQGFAERHLGHLFDISQSTVSLASPQTSVGVRLLSCIRLLSRIHFSPTDVC